MQFHFEPNLPHQTAAVDAVVRVFEGAPYTQAADRLLTGDVSGNVLPIGVDRIKANVAALAAESDISDYAPVDEPDFTIEMETGTGKTYVYLRTMFQLHRQYGLHKFVVVVPSVAVREGVLATLRDTRQHFQAMYGVSASIVEYSSKRLADVRGYCATNHLSIMVMNKQSFDSDSKVINAEDRDSGNLLKQLQAVQPVLILDEPQEGMDTENMRKRLATFNPLFKLRYSATHRLPKNVVYRLTPYDAYNQGLVKKIAVFSIHETNRQSNVAIQFGELILKSGKDPTAKLLLNVRRKSGEISEREVTVRRLDDLAKRTNNPVYGGWVVEDIGTTDVFDGKGYVKFTNGEQIMEGGTVGSDQADIFRQQIRRTIQNHFRRKAQLIELGIKPLALFFIDRVANYVAPDGLIRRLFVEQYTELYHKRYGTAPMNVDEVHNGYFAQSRDGGYTDSRRAMEGEGSRSVYDRILRDKLQLLALDDPLEFIFSHSALGVGWDNPNVFTICTLNESISQIKKRQEIGRGLRLCIRQDGRRYEEPEGRAGGELVNLLTVVPNESYHNFVATYQIELQEELGEGVAIPKIRDDNRTITTIKRNEERFSSDDFADLWTQLAAETRCRVHFREERLIEDGIAALSDLVVAGGELEISLHVWKSVQEERIESDELGTARTEVKGRQASLDIVGELSRSTALAHSTTVAILRGLPGHQKANICRNPMGFMAEATRILRNVVSREMVRLLCYEKTGGTLDATDFLERVIETKDDVFATPNRGLYDHIIHESEVERHFADVLDNTSTVRLFFKLPNRYTITTPIGNYTPDFALVMEKRDLDSTDDQTRFYFIVETKGTRDLNRLRPDERIKIECAIKHFQALGLARYLAPVDSERTFDDQAREATGHTFFTQ